MFRRDSGNNKLKISKPVKGIMYRLRRCGTSSGYSFQQVWHARLRSVCCYTNQNNYRDYRVHYTDNVFRKMECCLVCTGNVKAMISTSIGSFFGPFLGVSLSLAALQYTTTGIASTIMAMVPIFIIPPSILLFRHKVTAREMLGTLISLSGVALFFL